MNLEKKSKVPLLFAGLLAACILFSSFATAQTVQTSGSVDINLALISNIVNNALLTTANFVAGIANVSTGMGSIIGIILLVGVCVGLLVMVNPFDWLNRTGVGRWISMRK